MQNGTMHKFLKSCTRGMLYTPDGEAWPIRVRDAEESTFIYLHEYGGYGTQYGTKVDFYDDSLGVVKTECEVKISQNPDENNKEEPWVGQCKLREVKEIIQRHLDVRVEVNLPIVAYSEVHGTFGGTILNISAGGIRLVTQQELLQDDVFTFSYKFRAMERNFALRVLHRHKIDQDGIHYGCRFIDLPSGAESAVRGFVFQQLREKAQEAERLRQEEMRRRDNEARKQRAAQVAQDSQQSPNATDTANGAGKQVERRV